MTKTYSAIKEQLNIKVDKHLNDGFAHLTHYWQNHKNGVSQYFKPPAKNYLHTGICAGGVEDRDQLYIPLKFDVPFPPPSKPKLKFIDLFARIGKIRLAYQNLGEKCVFSSEWNNYKDGSEIFYFGVLLRVGLSVAIFLLGGTKRICASIPNAIPKAA